MHVCPQRFRDHKQPLWNRLLSAVIWLHQMEKAPSGDMGRWVTEPEILTVSIKSWLSIYLNQTTQAGPWSVYKSGGPIWGWLFPVHSWCALTGGYLRLHLSWLVSAVHFSQSLKIRFPVVFVLVSLFWHNLGDIEDSFIPVFFEKLY